MIEAPVGSRWRDQDDYRWRCVGHGANGWPIMRPDYGRSTQSVMTNPAWLAVWVRTDS